MTDFYIRESEELKDYKCDTNVIGDKNYFKYVSGAQYVEDVHEIPCYTQWYPRCNSYYPYTEDVDPVNRVSHLMAAKQYLPSFTALDTQPSITNPYATDEAQVEFLASKPATFIILGKPGIGEQKLGRLLSDHWKCVYIDPEILVEEEIQSGSRAGQCIEFNLRCGRAVAVDVILRLLEKRVNSKSARHRGFVICGFPLIRNDMYQEDLVSSESAVFTAQDIFEEILEPIGGSAQVVRNVSQTSHLSMASELTLDKDVEKKHETLGEREEEGKGVKEAVVEKSIPTSGQDFLIDVGSITTDICKITNIGTSYDEQLNFLFSLCHQPLVIIYIMCHNADVIKKHENYRYDLNNGEIVNLLRDQSENVVYTIFTKTPGFDNEELPEDFLGGLGEPSRGFSSSELKYLTYLPRDFAGNVAAQLKQYLHAALPTIEKRVLLHDPQYFVKVDGRTSPNRMFNIIKTKLRILPIPRVALPEKLLESVAPTGGEGDYIDDMVFVNRTPKECFEQLRKRKIISKAFKWKWSKWGPFCPVSMKEGIYVEGIPKYAVKFLDRIFFLSSEEAATKFLRNPRIYLLPPNPRPTCKIFVIGPKASGKSAVANCLGLLLNGKVLNPISLNKEYIERLKKERLDKIRTEAINRAVILLDEKRKREYEAAEWSRTEALSKLLKEQAALLEERLLLARLMLLDVPTIKTTAFPLKSLKSKVEIDPEVMEKYHLEYNTLRDKFDALWLPCFLDVELCEKLAESPADLINFAPERLKNPTPPPQPVSVFDKFVTDYADAEIEKAHYEGIDMSLDHKVEMYLTYIREAEEGNREEGENHGGWIVDGIPLDIDLIFRLYSECKPDDIFILRDPDITFLVERYRVKGSNEFRKYKDFFEHLGKPEIALKAPSFLSTMSYREGLARGVVEDILNVLTENPLEQVEEEEDPDEFVDVDYFATHATRADMKRYEQHLVEFEVECQQLINYFIENEVLFTELNIAGKSLPELLKQVVKCMTNKFRLFAHELTPEERMQEVEDFGEPEILGEAMGEEEEPKGDTADTFNQNRRLGDTNHYCPVTFHNNWVLWRGKEEYTAKYDDKLYFMCNDVALQDFLNDPQEYLDNKPPETCPPPRICVVGVPSSGKTTVAKYLSRSLGLYNICFEDTLKKMFGWGSKLDLQSLIRESEDNPDALSLINYLKSDQPLSEELLDKVNLKGIWFEEPIKSCGFVLDGYPKRPSDIDYMKAYSLIPDVILELSASDVEVSKRHVQKLIGHWVEKTQKAQEEQDKHNRKVMDEWEEKRDLRIAELRELKRQERFKAKMREKSELSESQQGVDETSEESPPSTDRSQVSYDSVVEETDLEDVLRFVAAELPEPVFHDDWETLEEVTERFINQTENFFVTDTEHCRLLKEYCDAELIDWVSVDANLSMDKVLSQAMRAVDKIKFRNKSFFERCYDVTTNLADKLLDCGYYFLSRFGRVCPVQLYEKINPVHMFLPLEQKLQLYPVIHRNYIYFMAGKSNRDKFYEDPLKYTMQLRSHFSIIPFRLAVIGPPKCGKTTLCERYKRDVGLKYISIGQAVRYVLRFLPHSSLANAMENVLRNGWELTSEMTMRCVEAMAFDGRSVTQGLVFDGFPNSIDDVRHLADIGLIPHLVADLKATEEDIHTCLATDKGRRGLPVFGKKFIDHRYEEWTKNARTFREWFGREYQIITEIPIKPSKWGIWNNVYEFTIAALFEIKHYFRYCDSYIGLRLTNMQVSPSEFLLRRSSFKHYCPCCLHYDNTLVTSGEPPDRTGMVQFLSNYYWLCDKHINKFIHNPEAFLTPNNQHDLPEELPVQRYLSEKPEDCYEDGICIICYWENQPRRVLNEGSLALACCYGDRTYLFDSKACLVKFMAKPQEYFSKVVNFKPTKAFASLKLDDLPVLGMLEQYVAQNVVKAVTNTGVVRPVLAGLGIDQAAALNIALHLKINNPSTPKEFLPMYEKAYKLFRDRRLVLIDSLARMKRTVSPFLHYEEPLLKLVLPTFGKDSVSTLKISSSVSSSSERFILKHKTRGVVSSVLSTILDQIDYA